MNLLDISNTIQNIAIAVSSIGLFVLAIIELKKWRAELLGKSEYEIAKKCYIAGSIFKNEIEATRSHFISTSEWQGRKKEESEKPTDTSIENEAYAYMQRYNKVREAYSTLKMVSYEAEAHFGKEVLRYFEDLEILGVELHNSIQLLFLCKLEGAPNENRKKYEAVVYGGKTNPDEYGDKLKRMFDEFTDYFGKYIRREGLIMNKSKLKITGIVLGFLGTLSLARGLVLSNSQIKEISTTYWDFNQFIAISLANNRFWAIIGFILIGLSLIIQLYTTWREK